MTDCAAIAVTIVDDDASFREGLAENLADDGHDVSEYENPRLVAPDQLAETDVLLLDYDMMGLDGLTFADGVHRGYPGLPIILVTAYWTAELEAGVAARLFLDLCRKPVDYDYLHARLHELVVAR